MAGVEQLKKTHQELVAELNRYRGTRETLLTQLKDEFGYDSLEDAKADLVVQKANLQKDKDLLQGKVDAFVKEFGARLNLK